MVKKNISKRKVKRKSAAKTKRKSVAKTKRKSVAKTKKSWFHSWFNWQIGDIGPGGARTFGILRFLVVFLIIFSLICTFAFAPFYMNYV